MTDRNEARQIRDAYKAITHPYAPYVTTAVTLTLKEWAKVKAKRFDNSDERFEQLVKLNDEHIQSTIRYFTARLTHYLFGHSARRDPNARPLVLITIEGTVSRQCPHLHAAIGNVPIDRQANLHHYIQQAWADCDFGNKQVRIEAIINAYGWLEYMTKEMGYKGSNAFIDASVPRIIQDSI